MSDVGSVALKVRSKNAGPFWITIDIFCGSATAFRRIADGLSTHRVAALVRTDPGAIKRFDIADLNVVKFSLPRPTVQGDRHDRDMHGAALAALVRDMPLN